MASQIKSILCPIDWSEPSRVALAAAVRMARHEGAEVRLLHVLPLLDQVPGITSMMSLSQAVQHEALEKLQSLAKLLVPPDVRGQFLIRVGDEAEEIYRAALESEVVVMSTQGRAGWEGWDCGSVAQTVMRETKCPIFVLGPQNNPFSNGEASANGCTPPPDYPFKKVLWPTDWSEHADRALTQAVTFSNRHGAQLLLLHVIEAPEEAAPEWWDEQDAGTEAEFCALLARRPELKDARRLVTHGDAASEIIRVAHAEDVDVLVMSSHGKTGLQNSDLGAVTRKVMRLVPCPVLLVPGTESVAPVAAGIFSNHVSDVKRGCWSASS